MEESQQPQIQDPLAAGAQQQPPAQDPLAAGSQQPAQQANSRSFS